MSDVSGDARATYSLASLQVLRGLAATSVVLFHAGLSFGSHRFFASENPASADIYRIFSFGHSGVDLFFVISGFIIMHAHWSENGDWGRFKRYAYRRFVRIYPITWLIVLGFILLVPVLRVWTGDPEYARWDNARLMASLTLMPIGCDHVFGALWSLNNELFFYAIFAFRYVSRAVFGIALTGWMALVLLNAGTGLWPSLSACGNSPLSLYNSLFVFGVASYLIAKFLRNRGWQFLGLPLILIGLVLFIAIAIFDISNLFQVYFGETPVPGEKFWKFVTRGGYGFEGAIVVVGAALLNWRASSLPGRILCKLGDASFVIYLVHEPVIGVFSRLFGTGFQASAAGTMALFGVLVAICLGLGTLIHVTIEKPVLGVLRSQLL